MARVAAVTIGKFTVQAANWVVQVDQPMCYECALRVNDEVEASLEEAKQECEAYQAAISRLAEEDLQPLTDEVYLFSMGCTIHICRIAEQALHKWSPSCNCWRRVCTLSDALAHQCECDHSF